MHKCTGRDSVSHMGMPIIGLSAGGGYLLQSLQCSGGGGGIGIILLRRESSARRGQNSQGQELRSLRSLRGTRGSRPSLHGTRGFGTPPSPNRYVRYVSMPYLRVLPSSLSRLPSRVKTCHDNKPCGHAGVAHVSQQATLLLLFGRARALTSWPSCSEP